METLACYGEIMVQNESVMTWGDAREHQRRDADLHPVRTLEFPQPTPRRRHRHRPRAGKDLGVDIPAYAAQCFAANRRVSFSEAELLRDGSKEYEVRRQNSRLWFWKPRRCPVLNRKDAADGAMPGVCQERRAGSRCCCSSVDILNEEATC